jgi:serine protease Do
MAARMADILNGGPVRSGFRGLPVLFFVAFCLAGAGVTLAAPPDGRPAPCRESIAALYRRVSPAVVSITAASVNPYDTQGRIERQSGSGVILDSSGLILTNSHVVFGHPAIAVTLDDGATLAAQIVGADPVFDIALIRIPPPSSGPLPTATLDRSDRLVTGDEVYAIGNPFGLDQTLTRGIVSAVNRILPGASWSVREPLIQTDAAINRGSSGGPLIDRCGAVVGITTAILADAQGIGFAIPVSLVRAVMPDLIKNGRVIRPWIGIQGQLVSAALKDLLREPLTEGLLVEVVEHGSPAERQDVSGGSLDVIIGGKPFLLGGDIITQIDGKPVGDPESLERALGALKVGATVRLALFREQKTRQMDVLVEERPVRQGESLEQATLAPTGGDLAPRSAGLSGTVRLVF